MGKVILHTFLVIVTGGLWLIPLGIYLAFKLISK